MDELPIFGTFTMIIFITGKNTSISLGDYFENFINKEIIVAKVFLSF